MTILATGIAAPAQVMELSMGVAYGVFRLLIGDDFHPVRVAIPHAPVSAPERYRRFFSAPVQFEQEHGGSDVAAEVLGRQVARDDPFVRQLATQFLDAAGIDAGRGVEGTMRRLIARSLPTGRSAIRSRAR